MFSAIATYDAATKDALNGILSKSLGYPVRVDGFGLLNGYLAAEAHGQRWLIDRDRGIWQTGTLNKSARWQPIHPRDRESVERLEKGLKEIGAAVGGYSQRKAPQLLHAAQVPIKLPGQVYRAAKNMASGQGGGFQDLSAKAKEVWNDPTKRNAALKTGAMGAMAFAAGGLPLGAAVHHAASHALEHHAHLSPMVAAGLGFIPGSVGKVASVGVYDGLNATYNQLQKWHEGYRQKKQPNQGSRSFKA
ncbi:MAG: hypothetical protein DDT26_00771 [Dehalococcoidia bacterium]|nr:hypothetical protein [Chloroflexota bacterium]